MSIKINIQEIKPPIETDGTKFLSMYTLLPCYNPLP